MGIRGLRAVQAGDRTMLETRKCATFVVRSIRSENLCAAGRCARIEQFFGVGKYRRSAQLAAVAEPRTNTEGGGQGARNAQQRNFDCTRLWDRKLLWRKALRGQRATSRADKIRRSAQLAGEGGLSGDVAFPADTWGAGRRKQRRILLEKRKRATFVARSLGSESCCSARCCAPRSQFFRAAKNLRWSAT